MSVKLAQPPGALSTVAGRRRLLAPPFFVAAGVSGGQPPGGSTVAATDPFLSTYRTDRSPFRSAAAITPSDSTDLTVIPRAVYVGAAGNVKMDMADNGDSGSAGNAVTIYLTAGVNYVCPRRVYSSGTAATGLVAVW